MNTWSKRKSFVLTCKPSLNEVTVQRPSPTLTLKSSRFLRLLQKVGVSEGEAKLSPEQQLGAIEKLSDDELDSLTKFAEIVLADVVVEPKLSLKPTGDQLSPADIPPADFWYIFIWVSNGCPDMSVELKDGETTIEAVNNFPVESGAGDLSSSDSEQVQ